MTIIDSDAYKGDKLVDNAVIPEYLAEKSGPGVRKRKIRMYR